MEETIITIKKKNYEISKKLDDDFYLVSFNGEHYVSRVFENRVQYDNFFKRYKKLKVSGVKILKILKKDKHTLSILFEMIKGESILSLLIKNELPKEIYIAIFDANFLALKERISLDYRPDRWYYDGKNLRYFSFYFQDDFDQVQKFEDDGIYYWVYSKQFQDYLRVLKLPIDKNRIKPQFEINKQIVQLVCLYHV